MAINGIYNSIGKSIDKLANNGYVKGQLGKSVSDPARFAAAMLVTSIVSKDLVGCGLYTTQSLYNEKIPEEKRKFVAALDLMNGILMVGGQFLIGKIIDAKVTPGLVAKFTGEFKDKHTGMIIKENTDALFHPSHVKKVINKIVEDNKINASNINVENIAKRVNKLVKGPFEKGFGIIIAALATTALTKRTIVPFLSTPLAGKCTDYLDKKEAEKHKTQDNSEFNKAVAQAIWQKDGVNQAKNA